MEEVSLTTILISVGSLLIGVFGGYWFNNINKKTESNRETAKDNLIEINKANAELHAIRLANEKAELNLKEGMAVLAKDMSKMASDFVQLGIRVVRNEQDIKHLKDTHVFISDRIRSREKKE